MADRYILQDLSNGEQKAREGITTYSGAGDNGKLVALDANGLLSATLLPSQATGPLLVPMSEALTQGQWVNLYNNGGVLNVRKADSTLSGGVVKLAHGFVLDTPVFPGSANVYTFGLNPYAIHTGGGFAVADRGKLLWLAESGNAGKCDYTPPDSDTTGNNVAGVTHTADCVVQPVGHIYDVNAGAAKVLFNQFSFKEKHSVSNTASVPVAGVGSTTAVTLNITPYLTGEYTIIGNGEVLRTGGTAAQVQFYGYEGATILHRIGAQINLTSTFSFAVRRSLTAGVAYAYTLVITGTNVASAGTITRSSLIAERVG